MCVCSVTLCDPLDCSPPGSSVREIFRARTLEWVAISSSRDLPTDASPASPALQEDYLPGELLGEPRDSNSWQQNVLPNAFLENYFPAAVIFTVRRACEIVTLLIIWLLPSALRAHL